MASVVAVTVYLVYLFIYTNVFQSLRIKKNWHHWNIEVIIIAIITVIPHRTWWIGVLKYKIVELQKICHCFKSMANFMPVFSFWGTSSSYSNQGFGPRSLFWITPLFDAELRPCWRHWRQHHWSSVSVAIWVTVNRPNVDKARRWQGWFGQILLLILIRLCIIIALSTFNVPDTFLAV